MLRYQLGWGHKSVSTTSNIYAHVTEEMRDNAARWMDSSYDPDNKDGKAKITLDQAIHTNYLTTYCLITKMNRKKQEMHVMNRESSNKNTNEPDCHQENAR